VRKRPEDSRHDVGAERRELSNNYLLLEARQLVSPACPAEAAYVVGVGLRGDARFATDLPLNNLRLGLPEFFCEVLLRTRRPGKHKGSNVASSLLALLKFGNEIKESHR
jgi:hypothetical protein